MKILVKIIICLSLVLFFLFIFTGCLFILPMIFRGIIISGSGRIGRFIPLKTWLILKIIKNGVGWYDASEKIGELSVRNTGGWNSWPTLDTAIISISGTVDIFLRFKGDKGELL